MPPPVMMNINFNDMCEEKEIIHFDFGYFLKANNNDRKAATIDALNFLGCYLNNQLDFVHDLLDEIKKTVES